MTSNDTTGLAPSSLDGLINRVRDRMVIYLKHSNRTYLKWPDCGGGFYWDTKRNACIKDTIVRSNDMNNMNAGTILIGHPNGIVAHGHPLDGYATYFYPLAVFFIVISMAIVLVVMRFYVEFLIYKFTQRERNAHELRNVHALRSEYGDSIDLPPPYPGLDDHGLEVTASGSSTTSNTSTTSANQIITTREAIKTNNGMAVNYRAPPPSYQFATTPHNLRCDSS